MYIYIYIYIRIESRSTDYIAHWHYLCHVYVLLCAVRLIQIKSNARSTSQIRIISHCNIMLCCILENDFVFQPIFMIIIIIIIIINDNYIIYIYIYSLIPNERYGTCL